MPYRDVTAEQKIADLEATLREAQDDLEEATKENTCLRRNRLGPFLENVSNPFWWAILFVLVVGSVVTYKAISADGKIDYCYVDTKGQHDAQLQRVLFGHRPWRSDAELRALTQVEDPAPLFALAKELGCPIR